MALAVCEPDDLVFDRRAVARARALDLAGIHGCAVEVGPDQVVDRRVGVGDMAVELGLGDRVGEERERDRVGIPGLRLQPGEIDRAAVQARRRAGLEALELKPK